MFNNLTQPNRRLGRTDLRSGAWARSGDMAVSSIWLVPRPKVGLYHDIPESWQLDFQDAASPVMEEIIFFHDQIMFILTIIITAVL